MMSETVIYEVIAQHTHKSRVFSDKTVCMHPVTTFRTTYPFILKFIIYNIIFIFAQANRTLILLIPIRIIHLT